MITFYSKITDIKNPHYKPLSYALERIKNPKKKTREIIDKIRASEDSNEIDELKKELPCVLFSGTFTERKDSALQEHSKYIVLDFDFNEKIEAQVMKTELKKSKYIYAAWISPSARGVKALVKIKYPDKHREHFKSLQKLYPNLDASGINVSRVCYESYDEDIYINASAEVWEDYEKTYEKKVEKIEITEAITDDYEIYKRVLKWLESRNDAFVSGQRNQFIFKLAAACCRFGLDMYNVQGFVATDFLHGDSDFTKGEAEKAIESAYRANKNLYGTARFEESKIINKETLVEVNPKLLEEGYKLTDVIYGEDVWDAAEKLYDNGYESAETTHIPALDEILKWKRGLLQLITGIGNHGKSEFLEYLMTVKALRNGDKFAVYSPENYPPNEWYFSFCERLAGCVLTPENKRRLSKERFKQCYEFVREHFFYVYPEQLSPTPQNIKAKFLELIITKKVSGVVVDPMNQMQNSYEKYNGRDDKYLEVVLGDFNRFAKENNVFFNIVAHPKQMQKNADGNYPRPDFYDLAGGAMYQNKVDSMGVFHRPEFNSSPTNNEFEFATIKSKKQRLFKRGEVRGHFDYSRRRYSIDGIDGLAGNEFEVERGLIMPNIEPKQSYYEPQEDDTAPF